MDDTDNDGYKRQVDPGNTVRRRRSVERLIDQPTKAEPLQYTLISQEDVGKGDCALRDGWGMELVFVPTKPLAACICYYGSWLQSAMTAGCGSVEIEIDYGNFEASVCLATNPKAEEDAAFCKNLSTQEKCQAEEMDGKGPRCRWGTPDISTEALRVLELQAP